MSTTIIIPTYFAGRMLNNCLDSIYKYCGSTKILIYKNDIGWLSASNEAMKSVSSDILLINDDILAVSDILGEMQKLAYSDPEIGIVGGMSLNPQNYEIIQNFGIYIAPDGNTAHKYFGQSKNSVKIEKQKAVEGSCMFIKREVLDKIGYFDEKFIAYREEVDLCLRAIEVGYKILSCPTAQYIHLTSQTHGRLGITNDSFDYFNEKWGRKLKLGLI